MSEQPQSLLEDTVPTKVTTKSPSYYQRLLQRKRQRQGSWSQAVCNALIATAIVFLLNLIFALVVAVRGRRGGNGFLTIYNGTCSESARYNAVFHVFINIAEGIGTIMGAVVGLPQPSIDALTGATGGYHAGTIPLFSASRSATLARSFWPI